MTVRSVAARVRPPLLRATEAVAEATALLRLEPAFLIVGAQRCGTTSMFKTLAQHPGVARPFLRKGIHYFDMAYERGPRWYRGHFPLAATSRLRRLGGAGPLTGESSPYYSFHPRSADRIAADLPEVKLIMLLRDPVERAYSAHSHELARGFETEPFERAIELEEQRIAGQRERMLADPDYSSYDLQHHAYVARGRYVEQLRRLEAAVGRDRLLVLDSDEFFSTPEPVFAEVLAFLGLPPAQGIAFERHNSRMRSPMDDALRARLRAGYDAADADLAAWWGRTPSWRR